MYFFVEFHAQLHGTILFQPRVAGVPHNLQDPSARIPAMKSADKAAGAEESFLGDIFGIQLAQTSLRSNEIHHEEPSQARIYSVSRITDERTNRGKYF